MSTNHAVKVRNSACDAAVHYAMCACGWSSPMFSGKRSHAEAAAAKWAHVDETRTAPRARRAA